jgi:hypothetical protein
MQRLQFRIRTFMIVIAAAAALMATTRLVLWLLASPFGSGLFTFVVLTSIFVGVQIGIIKLILFLDLPSFGRKRNAVSANRGRSEPRSASHPHDVDIAPS